MIVGAAGFYCLFEGLAIVSAVLVVYVSRTDDCCCSCRCQQLSDSSGSTVDLMRFPS